MMTRKDLIHDFYNAVDLLSEDERQSGVFFGTISITEAAGLEAILVRYTQYIDKLLQTLPLTPLQHIELLVSRTFTFAEYCMLWDMTIKQKDFQDYMIFRVLFISTDKERLLFTSVRQARHEDFLELLEKYTRYNNPFLHNFLYEIYN